MRSRVANAAVAFVVYLALYLGSAALLPHTTFWSWVCPAVGGVFGALAYIVLDNHRICRGVAREVEQHLREHTD
jgi:hypothetical protein